MQDDRHEASHQPQSDATTAPAPPDLDPLDDRATLDAPEQPAAGRAEGGASADDGAEVPEDAEQDAAAEPEDDADRIEVPPEELPAVLEALLFVSNEPVEESALGRAVGLTSRRVGRALDDLAGQLRESGSGLRLQRGPQGAQLVTAPELAEHVERFLGLEASRRLSTAALETLAIIAYRQPVTRGTIESIRGVSSDAAIATLRARGLVDEAGRAEGPGRPVLWVTTQRFLRHFGLERPSDLPPLPDDVQLPGESGVQLAMAEVEVSADLAALSQAAGAAFGRQGAAPDEEDGAAGETAEADAEPGGGEASDGEAEPAERAD